MAFRLYDADAPGGSQVGLPITRTVAISAGLFTEKLDFGAGAFEGDARWLGITVACPGDSGHADLGRQALTAAPYALYALGAPWSGLTDVPADLADGDDDTTYSAGEGLTLTGTAFSADTAYLQRRVSDTCSSGNAIRVINTDGTVTCEPVTGGAGDITAVNAGEGLTGGGESGDVTLGIDGPYQLPQSCANGEIPEWTGAAWACGTDDVGTGGGGGDITAVNAGTGLTGGGESGDVTLDVDFAGTGSADSVARSDHDHDTTYAPLGHTHPGSDITSAVPTATLALSTTQAAWSGLMGVPADLADGDDDTTYSAGDGLALSDTTFSIEGPYQLPQACANGEIPEWTGVAWACGTDDVGTGGGGGDITAVNAGDGLTGGGDSGDVTLDVDFAGTGSQETVAHSDHHHHATYYTQGQLSSGTASVHWDSLTNLPPGLDDGDNDTTYTAGDGLALTGTEFSADTAYLQRRVSGTCSSGNAIRVINADGSVTCQPVGAGDITAVNAGDGLTGGGDSGEVTLAVDFSGTGSATTAARSDHQHDDRYYTETELGTSGSAAVNWDNLTSVPADLADGDDDTTYDAGEGLGLADSTFSIAGSYQLPQTCSSGQIAEWGGAAWLCADDEDTVYAAGTGLSLTDSTFSIAGSYQLPQTCSSGQIAEWDGAAWLCAADDEGGGDITAVEAGVGLTGGGDSGDVTLEADFAGTGSATTVARSDHHHWGESWSGSGVGLTLESSDDDGLRITAGSGILDNGVHVVDAGDDGVYVEHAGDDGVYVYSAGSPGTTMPSSDHNGFAVAGAEDNGLYVGRAGGDGVHTYAAGNPSNKISSTANNGFEVAGAQGHGLYVGRADSDGVYVNQAGDDGISVYDADDDGVYVYRADGDGVQVSYAGGDGVYVYEAGDPATHDSDTTKNGIEVAGAEDNGLYVGWAGGNGVRVAKASWSGVYVNEAYDGVYVYEAGDPNLGVTPSTGYNGFAVAGAANHGLFVGKADDDGVYVYRSGQDGVYVYDTDDDGVHVSYAGNTGVYANTTQADHEWGFNTPDKIYAGTTLVSGGALMLVAQNGDSRDLGTGDVVALSGMGAAFGESDSPVPLVQRVEHANSTAAMGVVYGRFVAREEVEELEGEGEAEPQTTTHAHSADGPVAPGDHMLIVVLGPAQVKTEGLSGPISPGDALTTSASAGRAMKAEALELNGVAFYAPGTTIGKAMEPLDAADDSGLIWAWVTLQ
jgi:hypothetical protein